MELLDVRAGDPPKPIGPGLDPGDAFGLVVAESTGTRTITQSEVLVTIHGVPLEITADRRSWEPGAVRTFTSEH